MPLKALVTAFSHLVKKIIFHKKNNSILIEHACTMNLVYNVNCMHFSSIRLWWKEGVVTWCQKSMHCKVQCNSDKEMVNRYVAPWCSNTAITTLFKFPSDVLRKWKYSQPELSERLPSTCTFVVTILLRTVLRLIWRLRLSLESRGWNLLQFQQYSDHPPLRGTLTSLRRDHHEKGPLRKTNRCNSQPLLSIAQGHHFFRH